RTLPELLAGGNLRLDAVYTHFASADAPESPLFDQQRRNYDAALCTVDDLLCHDPESSSTEHGTGSAERPRRYLRHAANSAATLRDSRVWYDVVRPGLLLYGIV